MLVALTAQFTTMAAQETADKAALAAVRTSLEAGRTGAVGTGGVPLQTGGTPRNGCAASGDSGSRDPARGDRHEAAHGDVLAS